MPIFQLEDDNVMFPPARLTDESGILAVGGDLSPKRIIEAYASGVFPWFNPEDPLLWWSPDPRCVLYPENIKVSKSMRQLFRRNEYRVTFDQAFREVITACQNIYRPDQGGTWITDEMKEAYIELHDIGFMHSVEVWDNDELVGGLYGGAMKNAFFGESMFSYKSNASKYGFITLCKNLIEHNFDIIDCQMHTDHLESLGAEEIPREAFLLTVDRNQQREFVKEDWNEKFRTDFY
ncbi:MULTISPECIES: leucyl/phenylalanyl-tRNA--protein transferase [Flammeovirga]|uniref:Leucyl/phenylalanyl-tRNA--protein transferase n=1 Tax=Flammeovirga agarivorans TaxID=2726742 RepID=A0A7X8XWQ7_9BACT|nr:MULTISPECIES: leucyl/phenylalanyl-tRNA--protein transferase [Flammeovirga]NLR92522.1 leucyl/phenylalanyl-tRNA--protein transferase [Flammeovirga agarivorans]